MYDEYEIKLKLEKEEIWVKAKILDIRENNFIILNPQTLKEEQLDSLTINTNTTNLKLDEGKCEISWDLKGHQGWKEATLKKVKGVFAVVEYEEEGVLMSRVFHQSQVRKNLKRTITITPGDAYTLDISFIEENSGIENLIEGLKALMPIKFSLYFRSQVYIFGIENNEYNLNLLSYLTQTAKEHYCEVKLNEANLKNTKPKKNEKKQERVPVAHSASFTLEKFIYDSLKTKIDAYKKNSNVKISHRNTKDPNLLTVELKSNDKKLMEEVKRELNLIQIYITLDINEKDPFLSSNDELSLNSFIKAFDINSFNIIKIDQTKVCLKLLGREESIDAVSTLIREYFDCDTKIKVKEGDLEEKKRLAISF